jgi:hypothetical protein
MNTEWITNRLPTAEDALEDTVLVWNGSEAILWTYDGVEKGQPWASIHKLIAPYVKPKRWSLLSLDNGWILRDKNNCCYLPSCSCEAAERIADVFNEVIP